MCRPERIRGAGHWDDNPIPGNVCSVSAYRLCTCVCFVTITTTHRIRLRRLKRRPRRMPPSSLQVWRRESFLRRVMQRCEQQNRRAIARLELGWGARAVFGPVPDCGDGVEILDDRLERARFVRIIFVHRVHDSSADGRPRTQVLPATGDTLCARV